MSYDAKVRVVPRALRLFACFRKAFVGVAADVEAVDESSRR